MKRTRIRRRNEGRAAESFARNFGDARYVDWTRHEPCLFCGSRQGVRCAHVLHARQMGGRGGDLTDTGPVCFGCDTEWAQRGAATFLASWGLTADDLQRRVTAHHDRYAAQAGPDW